MPRTIRSPRRRKPSNSHRVHDRNSFPTKLTNRKKLPFHPILIFSSTVGSGTAINNTHHFLISISIHLTASIQKKERKMSPRSVLLTALVLCSAFSISARSLIGDMTESVEGSGASVLSPFDDDDGPVLDSSSEDDSTMNFGRFTSSDSISGYNKDGSFGWWYDSSEENEANNNVGVSVPKASDEVARARMHTLADTNNVGQ